MATNLDDDLDSKNWTVFAPTNEAFEALPNGAVELLMGDVITLTDLLLYHVTEGVPRASADLKCGGAVLMANRDLTRTLCEDVQPGSSSTTTVDNTNSPSIRYFQVGPGNVDNMPQIVMADIPACNGIVHAIDHVLLYDSVPTGTGTVKKIGGDDEIDDEIEDCLSIIDNLCTEESQFSTLCAALAATNLTTELEDMDTNMTLFAPTNEAFEKLGDAAIDYLLEDNLELLTNLLLFHTVPDVALLFTDLKCASGPDSLITMGNGEDSRTVCQSPIIYQKGAGNPSDRRPEIIEADVEACNGT